MHHVDEDSDNLKGMRIKMTTSHSATGQSTPSCTNASGSYESELSMREEEPKKCEGVFAIKTQGLTANSGTNPMNQGHGSMFFMLSTMHRNYSVEEGRFFGTNRKC